MAQMYEVMLCNGETVFYDGDVCLDYISRVEEDRVDVVTTLQNVYDVKWVWEKRTEVNSQDILEMPLKRLFSDYYLYDYAKDQGWY